MDARDVPHHVAPAGQTVAELLTDPRTLSAAEVIERTGYALAGRFATIAAVAELTVPWGPGRAG